MFSPPRNSTRKKSRNDTTAKIRKKRHRFGPSSKDKKEEIQFAGDNISAVYLVGTEEAKS